MPVFILFGFRSKPKVIAQLMLSCRLCHTQSAHAVVEVKRWFTLFFVPVIPLGARRLTKCGRCGAEATITKADVEQVKAQVAAASPFVDAPAPASPGSSGAGPADPWEQPAPWSGHPSGAAPVSPAPTGRAPETVACQSCGAENEIWAVRCVTCGASPEPLVPRG